jgi:hypothetical protein
VRSVGRIVIIPALAYLVKLSPPELLPVSLSALAGCIRLRSAPHFCDAVQIIGIEILHSFRIEYKKKFSNKVEIHKRGSGIILTIVSDFDHTNSICFHYFVIIAPSWYLDNK